jgi:hypothetical protein
MGRAKSTHGDRRNAYRILVGKPEGRRSLGGARHRRKDDIKMDLRGRDVMAWTELIWLRIGTSGGGGSCEHRNETSGSIKGKFLSS